MPEHCAAYNCSNRRTIANRARGITFHKFPKDKDVRKKWEVALRREAFTASDSSVLCSQHFKQDGVIPSVFSFPVHLQRNKHTEKLLVKRLRSTSLTVMKMAFIKEESEDVKIEETFRVKQEETEEQTDLTELKEESQELNEEEDQDESNDFIFATDKGLLRLTNDNQSSFVKSQNIAVRAINKIKAHALNDRIFRQLCGENDEAFQRLLLHTEVRWLSKGNCLARLCELFTSVLEFLAGADAALRDTLWSCRGDIFYLADFFGNMNEVSLKLQGDAVTLVHSKATICSFLAKLELYKQASIQSFPSAGQGSVVDELTDNHLLRYTYHLRAVDVPEWVMEPFQVDVSRSEAEIQETLIDLQNDEEDKATFRACG
ncbi:unnamed protein product [Leuciscus chuanchicus]